MSSSMKPVERAAANLAEYYLTLPATSVDVERLFSTAGDILSNERNKLKPENASKILFLKENGFDEFQDSYSDLAESKNFITESESKSYLTPPATSVDVEILFSTAGDILSNERNK